jgi:putative ABC transport system substrate-binding protein
MQIDTKRREFITLIGAAAALPLGARAERGERVRRIGIFINLAADDPESLARVAAFQQGLQQLGWTIGRNLPIDYRWNAGNAAVLRRYAADMRKNWSHSRRTSFWPTAIRL